MPSPTQFHVFLSAVSVEFRTERVQLENWLERKGLHVSSQKKFNQGDSTLWKKLHDEVARSQAVICVIGAEPGWPSGGELPQGAPERSWTQWEFWLAWGEQPWSPPRREKVYVFFPFDLDERIEKARVAAGEDFERLRILDLHKEHIENIKRTGKHWSTFKRHLFLVNKSPAAGRDGHGGARHSGSTDLTAHDRAGDGIATASRSLIGARAQTTQPSEQTSHSIALWRRRSCPPFVSRRSCPCPTPVSPSTPPPMTSRPFTIFAWQRVLSE